MNQVTNPDRRIIFVLATILILLVSAPFNLYLDLNIQNQHINGQKDEDDLFAPNATNSGSSNPSTPIDSEFIIQEASQSFTISCTDFMKLFDTISVLDIGNQVSENKVNQTTLDDIERIFNSYAGNCSQLDEYEFE